MATTMELTSVFAKRHDRRVTVQDIREAKRKGERWAMLTAYDCLTARIFEETGIPVLLVGDTSAMVVLGHNTTLPIALNEILLLVQAVVRGTQRALIVADLPFGTYEASPEQALASAVRLMKEGGAQAVKLEGGARVAQHIELLVRSGIPTIGHIGLTPQSIHAFGGFKTQGRGEGGDAILDDARTLEAAGAFAVVVEAVPAQLGRRITETISIPTIGIGAGPDCSAQVLVWQDMLGLTPKPLPKFAKSYADLQRLVAEATQAYINEVRTGVFPAPQHAYR
jgi:3-methyl-2-oxobutanoate hydroxymethyltransferase